MFVADAGNYDREAWKELIPQSDAVLQGTAVFGGKLFAQYEQNASSQLKLFDLDGKKISDSRCPRSEPFLVRAADGIAMNVFTAFSRSPCLRALSS